MIRRLLIPLLGSGLLLAGTATGALAKCEGPNPPVFCQEVVASINTDGSFGTFTAGTARSVDVFVSQGEQPFDAVGVALNFTLMGKSTVVRAQATPTGQPGMWRADVTLPSAGAWSLAAAIVTVDGNAYTSAIDTIQVAKPPQAPPAATPTPPVSPTTPALPIALLLTAIAAALLVSGMRDRPRRRAPAAGGGAAATANATNSERA